MKIIAGVVGWLPFWLVFALLFSQHAGAQSLVWTTPLYAQVPPWQVAPLDAVQGGTLADTPFMPDWDPDSRSVMLLSDVGEPGIVLAGRAQIDEVGVPVQPPSTPWLAKIAGKDGAVIWTWHFADYAEGHLAEAVADAAGDIVAVGTQWFADQTYGLLVIKVDAATGALRWRVDAPQGYFGLGVALDATGNVVVTATNYRVQQAVFKYARDDGALLWSSGIPDGADWDDGLVAVDGMGDVFAGGAYELSGNGTVVEDGIQIAKFSGIDGRELWSRRFVSQFLATAHALSVLPDGDVAFAAGFGGGIELVRLDGDNGTIVWERGDLDAADMLVDGEGRILVGGAIYPDDTLLYIADVQRIDANNGATLWRWQVENHPYTVAWQLGLGPDGQLFVGLSEGDGLIPFEAAGLDRETGAVRWLYAPQPGPYEENAFPVGILQSADGSVYFGGYNPDLPGDATWTTFKLGPIAADVIFLNGLD